MQCTVEQFYKKFILFICFFECQAPMFNKYMDPTDVNYMNVENKQVVIYIEEPIDYSNIKVDAMIKYLKSKGVIVVNSLEELEGVLK